MRSQYKSEKVRQAIAYIASKIAERGNMYKVLKVMYFADKCHLRQFGRVIFGDQYVAMKHGPVPWSAYRKVSNERDRRGTADSLYKVEGDNTIVPLLNPELDAFSDSDIACIDEEIAVCERMSFAQLKARSHDEAYKGAQEDDAMTVESIAAAAAETPEERERLLEHLADA